MISNGLLKACKIHEFTHNMKATIFQTFYPECLLVVFLFLRKTSASAKTSTGSGTGSCSLTIITWGVWILP